jgi:hypothetical protein
VRARDAAVRFLTDELSELLGLTGTAHTDMLAAPPKDSVLGIGPLVDAAGPGITSLRLYGAGMTYRISYQRVTAVELQPISLKIYLMSGKPLCAG